MGKVIGICPKCGQKIEIGSFDKIICLSKTGSAMLKKTIGNAGKAAGKAFVDFVPTFVEISGNAIGERISDKDAESQSNEAVWKAVMDGVSNFINRTYHDFKHLDLQALSDLQPKCDHCGYKCTRFDTIKFQLDEIDERVRQTGDFSRYFDRLPKFIGFLEGNNNDDDIKKLISDLKLKMRDLWTPDENGNRKYQFTKQKQYDERKVIFVAKSFHDVFEYIGKIDSINYIFTPDCIPSDIKFPLGQPNVNSLYIANPVKPDEYVPYDNYELTLFMDKIRELKRLLRYLGATEITFTSLRGTKIEEAKKMGSSVNAEAGLLGHKVGGGYSSEDGQNRMSGQGIKVDYIERLNSNEYPSLPDGLYWYNDEHEWQDIVEARLHLNQLHFEQSISTNQLSSLDKQSQENINAAYENLIFHINANYDHKQEFHVKTNEETMWRITAEFKPLSEFENSDKAATKSQQNLSSNEQNYLDLVKKVSAGGMISELNRKMLEQIRIKLKISEERAKDLETSLIPQLSEEEKQYLEAVRQYLADGIIGENERVLLQTLRELNNISEERASELEAMA
jgi:hypothetical protein